MTTGSSALWPVAGIFDYLSLRTNGYQFHSDLAAGKISWTSPEARAVFAEFGKLQPFVTENHAAIDWQDAAAIFVQGKAAHYVMGNFAVGVFKEGGMTNDNLGFMVFPEITAGIARAEEAPTDTIHLTSGAKNPEDAKTFLAYMASAEAQSKWNAAVGQLPTNKNATVDPADPFLTAGFAGAVHRDGRHRPVLGPRRGCRICQGRHGRLPALPRPARGARGDPRAARSRRACASTRSDLTMRAPPDRGAPVFCFGGQGMAQASTQAMTAAASRRGSRWNQRTIAPWLFLAPGLFMFTVYVLWPIVPEHHSVLLRLERALQRGRRVHRHLRRPGQLPPS